MTRAELLKDARWQLSMARKYRRMGWRRAEKAAIQLATATRQLALIYHKEVSNGR